MNKSEDTVDLGAAAKASQSTKNKYTETLLAEALAHPDIDEYGGEPFLRSLSRYYDRNGYLTPRQTAALCRLEVVQEAFPNLGELVDENPSKEVPRTPSSISPLEGCDCDVCRMAGLNEGGWRTLNLPSRLDPGVVHDACGFPSPGEVEKILESWNPLSNAMDSARRAVQEFGDTTNHFKDHTIYQDFYAGVPAKLVGRVPIQSFPRPSCYDKIKNRVRDVLVSFGLRNGAYCEAPNHYESARIKTHTENLEDRGYLTREELKDLFGLDVVRLHYPGSTKYVLEELDASKYNDPIFENVTLGTGTVSINGSKVGVTVDVAETIKEKQLNTPFVRASPPYDNPALTRLLSEIPGPLPTETHKEHLYENFRKKAAEMGTPESINLELKESIEKRLDRVAGGHTIETLVVQSSAISGSLGDLNAEVEALVRDLDSTDIVNNPYQEDLYLSAEDVLSILERNLELEEYRSKHIDYLTPTKPTRRERFSRFASKIKWSSAGAAATAASYAAHLEGLF